MDKRYLSQSALGMVERCGEQYRFRYIEGIKIPPAVAMIKGTGVHGGAKHNFSQKIESHKDLKKSVIVEAAVTEFERAGTNGVELNEDEKARGKTVVLGEAKDSVVSLSGLYADEVAPEYQPVYVEARHRLVLPGPYDLVVIMDVADDKNRVIDLKTGAKKKPQSEADTAEQLSFYALVYRALTGALPSELRLEVLVDKKTPERQTLTTARDEQDIEVLVNRINTAIKGIEAGIFVPAPPNSWQCDSRYCGFFNLCPYVKHNVKHNKTVAV